MFGGIERIIIKASVFVYRINFSVSGFRKAVQTLQFLKIIYIEHEKNNVILKSFLKWEAFHSTER